MLSVAMAAGFFWVCLFSSENNLGMEGVRTHGEMEREKERVISPIQRLHSILIYTCAVKSVSQQVLHWLARL